MLEECGKQDMARESNLIDANFSYSAIVTQG